MLPYLKLLRNKRGISQQKLAEALGISQQSVNQYENQSIEPDIGILSRMADYFETSIDYIVGRSDVRRAIEPTRPYDLNAEESALIDRYRALTPRERRCVAMVADTLVERE